MKATITFIKPDGASIEDVAEFIDDALSSMGGCRHPDDPMFSSLKMSCIRVHGTDFAPRGDEGGECNA